MVPFLIATAEAQDPAEPSWNWEQPQRFYLESQVKLPLVMWLATPVNRQARASAFELRLLTTCGPGEPAGRSTHEVFCTLDDVGLLVSGLSQEEGLLQPIAVELDEMLTGAAVQLVVRDDGRLVNLDLEHLERRNPRTGAIHETLRQVVSRAFAGLDLLLPESVDSGAYPQYGAWLMRAPSADGSSGMSEIVHSVVSIERGRMSVVSGGRGLISPGEGKNQYEARASGTALFDLTERRLLDRSWIVVGAPTASSHIAFGAAGYPYVQQGRVVALTGAETWDVGESGELPPGLAAQTAIQQLFQLGPDPNGTP